ncbi:MAG TPA: hypothetical protein ENI23_17795 [bacterium]|nr:hypothetical protein [bacterium]
MKVYFSLTDDSSGETFHDVEVDIEEAIKETLFDTMAITREALGKMKVKVDYKDTVKSLVDKEL